MFSSLFFVFLVCCFCCPGCVIVSGKGDSLWASAFGRTRRRPLIRTTYSAGRPAKTWTARTRAGATLLEAGIRRATEQARDIRKLSREIIVIDALRELRRNSESAVAVVEISHAFDVFIIGCEAAIVVAARAARPRALLEPVTGMHFLQRTVGVSGVAVAERGVDREAIRGPAHPQHLFPVATEPRDKSCGQAVIMIGAGGLDVGVVLVETEIDEP